ncbi:MAG TPA: hypothetical protein VEJ22_06730 [Nitrospirota bacterium]|nr:hypothetical protein [Nitrospirota bacterium]
MHVPYKGYTERIIRHGNEDGSEILILELLPVSTPLKFVNTVTGQRFG